MLSLSTIHQSLIGLACFLVIGLSAWAGEPEKKEVNKEVNKETSSAESQSENQRPKTNNLRFEEDWSQYHSNDRTLKFIPLNESGSIFASVGGQARFRSEFFDNFGFTNLDSRDDAFALLRIRLHSDVYLGSYVRVFVEGKSALSGGRELPGGTRTLDTDTIDLQNALVDFKLPTSDRASLTFRLGRQELQYGKQRLVSPLDWSNTRPRTFDAVKAIVKFGKWRLDGFWGRHVLVRRYDFNTNNSGTDFFGAYLTGPLPSGLSLDLYWLGLDRQRATFGGTAGQEDRHTFGGRLGGKLGDKRFDFDLETAVQVGDQADRDIQAFMLASQIGFAPSGVPGRPRVYLGFDYASGDDDPTDGDLGTFNQLFPLGHAYFGYIDTIARQNIVDLSSGAVFHPSRRLSVKSDLHIFWRDEERDALYNAGGGVVRAGAPGTPLYVGSELDLTFTVPVRRGVVASFGISRFFAGDFLEATGSSDDVTFGHVGLKYTF